ncbi:septation protein SepH [Janibacter anophelis]|uniref:septation protein SepH n=1 Tax=Janibacter anophelis TaxID=319054 RepID=UPI0008312F36|nr:septation protein SepH [Janibacter anophelis]
MRDLRLIGVHDDGEHLVVTDDAGEEYRLRIDDQLRAAARRDRPRLGQLQIAIDNDVRPREVQAMIRAGATADEVAARTGWDPDKIARFEGPVIAEREHVATRAQGVRMRGTNQAGSPETLAQRAATRLTGRGVEPSTVLWDARRDAEGQWTVSAVFAAGGRERTATWWFDMSGMSVVAKNDEAKWLSEADTPAGPVPTSVHRPTAVFDVEVEESKVERATRANTDDLIQSMREQSGAKRRGRGGRRRTRSVEAPATPTEDALPLDELPPPAGGTHPRDEAKGATPESSAAPKASPAPEAKSRAAASPESPQETDEAPDAEMRAEPEQTVQDDVRPEATTSSTDAAEPAQGTTAPAADDRSTDAEAPQDEDADDGSGSEPSDDTTADHTASESKGSDDTGSDGKGSGGKDGGATARGRKGRAKVPSWDDVMFGTTRE